MGENSKKSKASNLVKSRFWGIFVSIEYVKNKCYIGIKMVHFYLFLILDKNIGIGYNINIPTHLEGVKYYVNCTLCR